MNQKSKLALFIALVVAGVATRFLPHAPNFTAIGATALFGGVVFKDSLKAFLIPAIALFLSDLVLNNVVYAGLYEGFQWITPGFAYIYGAFFITVLMARSLTMGYKVLPLVGAGFASTIAFYLITNFGAWAGPFALFPKTFDGLMETYMVGLPFLLNQMGGTFFYGAIMFGSAYYLTGAHKLNTVNA